MRPRGAKSSRTIWLVLGVLLCGISASCAVGIVWVVIKAAGQAVKDDRERSRDDAPALNAGELADVYAANEVDGDRRYKGRMVKVTGVVVRVAKDVLNSPFVVIGSGEMFQTVKVQCFFDAGQEIASLRPGDMVTVTGVCAGKSLNVKLTSCRVEH